MKKYSVLVCKDKRYFTHNDIKVGDEYQILVGKSTGMILHTMICTAVSNAHSEIDDEAIVMGMSLKDYAKHKDSPKPALYLIARRRRNTFKIYAEIPSDIEVYDYAKYSEEEVQAILNPYPPIIKQLVAIMEKYGESWKDDCREQHLDDFKPYEAAEAIHKALISQQLDLVTNQLIPYERKESEAWGSNSVK